MNHNDMSLDECWEWLCDRDVADFCHAPSLGALYAAVPEGLALSVRRGFDGEWVAFGTRRDNTPIGWKFTGTGELKAPDHLTCIARLVVAMRMEDAKG